MAKRLQQDILTGPNNELVEVNWMPPGNRIRIDFIGCAPAKVTKIFTNPGNSEKNKINRTSVEIEYSPQSSSSKTPIP